MRKRSTRFSRLRFHGSLAIVKADLPGLEKDDVEVRVENGFLIVKGERKEEREEKEVTEGGSEVDLGDPAVAFERLPDEAGGNGPMPRSST